METVSTAFTWLAAQVSGPNGFYWALGSYVAMILTERLGYLFEGRRDWHERDAVANIINSSVTAIGDALIGGAIFVAIYFAVYEVRLFDVPSVWWGWALALLLNDLAYYVDHRIAHRTGLFWAVHTTHHSSKEMNLTVASRGTVMGLGGAMQPVYFLLPLLGVSFPMFVAAKFFGNLWGIFNHTRLVKRMGFLDEILATPANHRVHHGTQAKYLDRNYGQTLIIWDRLFGTFQREEEEPVYGLVTQLESRRIWDIQTSGAQWLIRQMRSADTAWNAARYLWMPPGWRHDGCHATSEMIRNGMPGCLAAGATTLSPG
jgi:sterol desaturase/sphingolipid hydroxylase (fatty acid hydroxylase superfamily)